MECDLTQLKKDNELILSSMKSKKFEYESVEDLLKQSLERERNKFVQSVAGQAQFDDAMAIRQVFFEKDQAALSLQKSLDEAQLQISRLSEQNSALSSQLQSMQEPHDQSLLMENSRLKKEVEDLQRRLTETPLDGLPPFDPFGVDNNGSAQFAQQSKETSDLLEFSGHGDDSEALQAEVLKLRSDVSSLNEQIANLNGLYAQALHEKTELSNKLQCTVAAQPQLDFPPFDPFGEMAGTGSAEDMQTRISELESQVKNQSQRISDVLSQNELLNGQLRMAESEKMSLQSQIQEWVKHKAISL